MSRSRGVLEARPSDLTEAQLARRERVLDAALRLSRQRAFDQIQVKDVAEEAGVALGTVYHYFASKDHLFAEALVRWVETPRQDLAAHLRSERDPAARLRGVLHRYVEAFQRRPTMAKLVTALAVSPDAFAVEAITRLDTATSAVFREALVGVDGDVATSMVRVIDHVLAGLLRHWSAGRLSIVEVYEGLDDMVDLLFES